MATQARPGSSVLKRAFVGRAMASSHLEHTLLPKILALPVFSSDPMSSVAYATEEIMIVLLAASASGKADVFPISIAIAALLGIVVVSYRQTVRAYPNGGGAYIVSKENIGTGAGPGGLPCVAVGGVRPVHHARQPPRGPGVGHPLRDPHLWVHRDRAGHDR